MRNLKRGIFAAKNLQIKTKVCRPFYIYKKTQLEYFVGKLYKGT